MGLRNEFGSSLVPAGAAARATQVPGRTTGAGGASGSLPPSPGPGPPGATSHSRRRYPTTQAPMPATSPAGALCRQAGRSRQQLPTHPYPAPDNGETI